MGVTVVAIGALLGLFISATLTQCYYYKRYGSNGLPCFSSERPLLSLDLGWNSTQMQEITDEIHDLASRAHMLERELAEIRLTRLAVDRARAMGEEGQELLKELRQMKNLRKNLNRRIVGGLGQRIYRAGVHIKSPFWQLMGQAQDHDVERGDLPLFEQGLGDEDHELLERELQVQSNLADLRAEKDLLEQIKVSEGH